MIIVVHRSKSEDTLVFSVVDAGESVDLTTDLSLVNLSIWITLGQCIRAFQYRYSGSISWAVIK